MCSPGNKPGNHDITLDAPFYTANSSAFHNQSPQCPVQCLSLLTSSPSITYLSHQPATVRLSSPSGPHTTFTVFGSPYSPRARSQDQRNWAFQYDPDDDDGVALWRDVPLDTDVLVTHTPARGHRDEGKGCEALRRAMWRVRPRLAVCGHVHAGRGAERVTWDLDGGRGNVPYAESWVEGWTDGGGGGGGGKISLVDLTGRRGRRLDNDGGHPRGEVGCAAEGDERVDGKEADGVREEGGTPDDLCYGLYRPKTAVPEPFDGPRAPTRSDSPAANPGIGTIGLGFSSDGGRSPVRSDAEALEGRMGRRETCVVNCAVTATSWPHGGGRRFNKPIVVDLDLPVWDWEMEQEDGASGLVGRTE